MAEVTSRCSNMRFSCDTQKIAPPHRLDGSGLEAKAADTLISRPVAATSAPARPRAIQELIDQNTFGPPEGPRLLNRAVVKNALCELSEVDMAYVLEQALREHPTLAKRLQMANFQWLADVEAMPTGGGKDLVSIQTTDTELLDEEGSSAASEVSYKSKNIKFQLLPKKGCRNSVEIRGDLEALPRPTLATVQFTAPMFFAQEHDEFALVELMRIGTASAVREEACVCWTTEDGSAKAGLKYHACAGKVVFPPGEIYTQIRVKLIQSSSWDPTLDFLVALKEDGFENVELHRYHMKCRVKVMDDDAFPSSKYKQQVDNNQVAAIPGPQLMIEYFKMNLRNEVVRRGSKKCLAADFLINLAFMTRLVIKVWMINELFMPVLGGDKEWEAADMVMLCMVSVCFFIPEHVLQIVAFRRNYWKVGGASRKSLQANLMRKYMTYTDSVRTNCDHGVIVLLLYKAIPEVVADAYSSIFPIVKNVTLLILIMLYQGVGTNLLGLKAGQPQWVAMNCAVLAAFPVVMAIGLKLRADKSRKLLRTTKNAEEACTSYTIDMLANFFLLADYCKRGRAISKFESKINAYNGSLAHFAACECNNEFLPVSLTIGIRALWILGGGTLLMTNQIAMGTFLANWSIFEQIGGSWHDIYKHVLMMNKALTDLRTLVRFMNYESNTGIEMGFINSCDKIGREMAREMMDGDPDFVAVDNTPVRLMNVHHQFQQKVVFHNIQFDMMQGRLHCIAGRRGCGKTTLLSMIAGRLLIDPGDGVLAVPSHLRVLHISKEPLFFTGSLYENLVYGVLHGDKDGRIERVLSICQGLDIKDDVLKMIDAAEDAPVEHWYDVLSRSDCQLLNMARGLVASPEVLCIHKPSMGLGPNTVPVVFNMLRTFVRAKGVVQDPSRYFFRRPKTCIFTFTSEVDLQYADEVHYPSSDQGAQPKPKTIWAPSL